MCSTGFPALAAAEAAGNNLFAPETAQTITDPSSVGGVARAARAESDQRLVEFEVPGRAGMLALIRYRVVEFARSMPFTEDELEDIKLAVGEASANAVRHGAAAPPCKVGVRMERRARCLKISITDRGCGFDPASVRPLAPDSLDETGRGIAIMRALVDKVRFRFNHPGTRVELTKRVRVAYS